jgi:uncharacterized membrane protein
MNQRSFNSALLLGVTAGLRSMTAPAALALAQQQKFGRESVWPLNSPRVGRVLMAMAVGEMILDKLPFAPNRIAPGVLTGRLLSGAMCGAAVSRDDQKNGALLGVVGALAGSFAGYFLRKGAVKASGLPDAVIALAEDALAVAVGWVAVNPAAHGRGRVIEMHNQYVA